MDILVFNEVCLWLDMETGVVFIDSLAVEKDGDGILSFLVLENADLNNYACF